MKWNDYKLLFTWDGTWRDLYILQTSLTDWQNLLDFLKSSDYLIRFSREKEESLPESAAELFASRDKIWPLLQISLGGLWLNCHFFTEEEIEFDLDPRDVLTERDAEALFEFMRAMGRALHKPVRMTPENMEQVVLLEYDPETDLLQKINDW